MKINRIIDMRVLLPVTIILFLILSVHSESKAAEDRSRTIAFDGRTYSLTFFDDFDFFDDTKWAYLPEIERADAGGVWSDSSTGNGATDGAELGTWGGEVQPSMLPAHFYVDSVDVYSEIKDVSIMENPSESHSYGVYIGQDNYKTIKRKAKNKKTIVIEGQSFTKKQIKALKKGGRKIYSYLNIGSVETYRPYFNSFRDCCLKVYENWEDEYWIDVSKEQWQDFIVNTLAKKLIKKGIDGFFIDNCDVYYQYPTGEIYDGLHLIIQRLNSYGADLIINGGDTFVSKLIKDGEQSLISGVNQETVFSRIIDYDKDRFGIQKKSETEYYKRYLSTVKKNGLKVFMLEYTRKKKLKKHIRSFCKKNGYIYYISDSIQLR